MNPHDKVDAVPLNPDGQQAPEIAIPELVGKLYDVAPATDRCRMLEQLMKPLGVLALVGVCNGIFAKMWFRSGWHDLHIRPEDAQAIRGIDVTSLVDFVQQVNGETIDRLIGLLTTSPMLVYSASAAVLLAALVRHAQKRRGRQASVDNQPDSALPSD